MGNFLIQKYENSSQVKSQDQMSQNIISSRGTVTYCCQVRPTLFAGHLQLLRGHAHTDRQYWKRPTLPLRWRAG